MENVFVVVYCDGEILSSSEGILFECPSGPKVVIISEDMSLDALRKTIMDAIGDCKIYIDFFTANMFMQVMVVLNASV